MTTRQLSVLFCQAFDCPPSEYEERAFSLCLYWHAKLLAPVVRRLNPDFFAEDFKFIRYLGASTTILEVAADLENFRNGNVAKGSFWRVNLKIRVSGRKASWLARELFFLEQRSASGTDRGRASLVNT